MTTDNDKLVYDSRWDIDQLVATDTVTVGVGTTAIYTITSEVQLPEFEVQFKPTGTTLWRQAGVSSTDGTLGAQTTFSAHISSGVIYINTDTAGTARYFVWADKVNY